MNEQLIVSGRDIPILYPHLDVWGIGIPIYLFIGGLAAGILLFSTYFYMRKREDKYFVAVKVAPIIPPLIIALGLLLLIEDLHHPQFFWQLLTHFRIKSPMSWGAWVLTFVFLMSIFWSLIFTKDLIEYFDKKGRKKWANAFRWIDKTANKLPLVPKLIEFTQKNSKAYAFVLFILSLILGTYTGILLSANNARPLWNNSILGPLFLTSGVSTAAATVMWLSDNEEEKKLFSRIDIALIFIELFFIIHMIMGMFAGPELQVQTVKLLVGGQFTLPFWVLFVGLGLLFPLTLEIMEQKGFHIPIWIPALFILIGGFIFRYIIVIAGEISTIPH